MEEIEVKILDINRDEIVPKLLSLGAKKVFDGKLNAHFFDFSDNSVRNNNRTVRLREEGEKVFLTFKDPVPHETIKIRDEHEVEVSDFNVTKKILESLGLSSWLILKKHRTSFALDDAHFEFDKHHDQYDFVPEYLEIEAKDIETIHKYVELLGLRKEDCKPWTIHDIVKNVYPEKDGTC